MKKARIVLSGIAVCAVLAGAFAFKTKVNGFYIYQKNGTTCPRINLNKYLVGSELEFQNVYTTTVSTATPATTLCTQSITVDPQ